MLCEKISVAIFKFRKDNIMFSSSLKRCAGRRISIWVLVFALMLVCISSTLIFPASAANMAGRTDGMGSDAGEAMSDVGDGMSEAISDVGEGMSEAISDALNGDDDGKVNDTDGLIGNADSGADKAPATDTDTADNGNGNGGWIALAIAIVVVVAVVVLVIVLIPRRKDTE